MKTLARSRTVSILVVLSALIMALSLTTTASAAPASPTAVEPAHDHSTHDHRADAAAAVGDVVPNGTCEAAGLWAMADGACTHGADEFSDDFMKSAEVVTASLTAQAAPCTGDGVTGPRVQLVYARASDRPDNYASSVSAIRTMAGQMDAIVDASAAQTGGSRHIKFMHDASCVPTVLNAVLGTNGDDNFTNTINGVRALGMTRALTRYVIFLDTSGVLCGIGQFYNDDQPGSTNANNNNTLYSRVDKVAPNGANCWQPSVALHELVHNMGGVQNSAPHSTYNRPTGNPGGHCVDEYDIMCYSDFGGGQPAMQYICNTPSLDTTDLDCNNDDYFNTSPPAGSYLATKWNVANNQFLSTGSAPPPSCPDQALEPDESMSDPTGMAVPGTLARAFCAAGDQDWASLSLNAGTQYKIETLSLGTTADTVLDLFASGGATPLASNDDRSSTDPSSLITYTPTTSGAFFVKATQYDGTGQATNTYTLSVTVVSAPPPSCPDQSLEPDESMSDPTGLTVPGNRARAFCVAGDQDWTSVSLTAGTQYKIETLSLGSTADTVLDLFASGGATPLASNDDRTSTDVSSLITFTPSTTGTYFVKATQYDGTGLATNTYTLSVTVVSSSTNTPPTVQAPAHTLQGGQLGTSGQISVRISWSATDPNGISKYELQQSTNGGAFVNVTLTSLTATSRTLSLALGSTYRFQVRATDGLGLASAYVAGAPFSLEGHQESSPSVAYTGSWTGPAALSGAYGGSTKYASAAGSKAVFTTAAGTAQVAIVTVLGPGRGKFDVYVDGVKVTSTPIDTYSSSTSPRRVAVIVNFSDPSVAHTVEVRVLGTKRSTSTGTRVDVDGFVVRK